MNARAILGMLAASVVLGCGTILGADWDGKLRPDDASEGGEAPDGGSDPDGASDGGSDSAVPPCDACAGLVAEKVAAGADHSCALVAGGAVYCWGSNVLGQLGNGDTSTTKSAKPVRVTSITNATAIVSEESHTCALVNDGDVACWGWNAHGQLGSGAAIPESVPAPVTVSGLPGKATALAVGWGHSCAVVDGALYCWGDNEFGQLGNGAKSPIGNPQLTPGLVTGLTSGVTDVSANLNHACAIVSGGAKCWGQNGGALGNKNVSESLSPVDVYELSSVTSIAAGESFSCGVASGEVSCWGVSTSGALGDPAKTFVIQPNPVPGLASAATFVSAGQHACAIVAGGARCWGDYPGDGSANATSEVAVSGPPGASASALAAGKQHACAVVAGGAVMCWGSNGTGQLGVPDTTAPTGEALKPVRAEL